MGRERGSRTRGVVGWVVAAVMFGAAGTAGQIPDELTNLQVLPGERPVSRAGDPSPRPALRLCQLPMR